MHTLANLSMNLLYMYAIGQVNNKYAHFGESQNESFIHVRYWEVNNNYARSGESQHEYFTHVRY